MTHFFKKHNQKQTHKPIRAASLFDYRLRKVGGKLRISHIHFANMFDLSPQLVEGNLLEWAKKDGQRDTVWATESDVSTGVLWADYTAVLAIADFHRMQPTVIDGLLTAMGFYDDPSLGVAA